MQYEKKIRHYPFLPTTKDEIKRLGWEQLDVVLFSGDAYIDHPSFGTAIIARVLEKEGYKVGVVAQPNWRDDLRDFKKLGRPRLFFGVSAGAMDSMVNHYTAFKRLRSNDSYTPGGAAGFRPDYAVTVYTKILKSLFPDVPIVIGGIEASLRRVTHYDYWQDKLFPSILIESGADFLTYGMGEKAIIQIARYIDGNKEGKSCRQLLQTAYFSTEPPELDSNTVTLPSFESCCADKKEFVKSFNEVELQANLLHPKRIIEPVKNGYVYINEPFPPLTQEELDAVYALPYTMQPHPRYKGKTIPAYEMIKNSITIHRGCFGGCSFCTIAAHQGKFIQSRSTHSILSEIEVLKQVPGFSGNLSDVGAPSANMYMMGGKNLSLCKKCRRKSCIYPSICLNLNRSHKPLTELYRKIDAVSGIRHSFIGSGVRYDLLMDREGYLDKESREYFTELISKHISGRFKVAPEHTEEHVLQLMNKPSFALFCTMKKEFGKICKQYNLNQQIVPYFISSHPGCHLSDMKALAANPNLQGVFTEQVQSFTPTPMTRSSVMFYTGLNTKTLAPLFVEKNIMRQREQKSYFFKK